MASVKVACMVVMCMAVVSAPMVAQAVTCGQVTTSLAPCLGYLMNGGAAAPECCTGVKNILGAAGTAADKQTVCNCLKDAAGKYNINEQYAQALPGVCKVNVPYNISRSTNCAEYVQSIYASLTVSQNLDLKTNTLKRIFNNHVFVFVILVQHQVLNEQVALVISY